MPGFDKGRFVEVSDYDLNEFLCGICYEIFDNPVFSPCCRQTYCSDCINQWLTQHNTCPNDRKTLKANDLSPPPRVLINLLNNMKINCDFHTNGCEVVNRLSDLPKHTEICSFNPNRKCENCGLSVGNDHNCIHNLKVKNESINDEIIRIRNENSDLKEENQRLHRSVNSTPTLNRNDKTLRIINSKMPKNMTDFSINIAHSAHNKFRNEPEGKLATFIRNEFEKKYNTLWNCLVSTSINWGTSIHHYEDHYIYFKIGLFHFMIWESTK